MIVGLAAWDNLHFRRIRPLLHCLGDGFRFLFRNHLPVIEGDEGARRQVDAIQRRVQGGGSAS